MKTIIKNRYGVVPNEVLNDPTLSLKDKGLYAFIQSKPDNWEFSIARIAVQTRDGQDGVRTSIHNLERAGYLRRIRYQDKRGFWLVAYALYAEPTFENPGWENPTQENTPNNSNKEYSKKDYSKKETDMRFELFWQKFDKKVERKKCEQKWMKLSDEDRDKAIDAVDRYVEATPEKRYRKNPITWLNGECWNDELDTGQSGTSISAMTKLLKESTKDKDISFKQPKEPSQRKIAQKERGPDPEDWSLFPE